jgi:hypothetical protein
MTAPSLTVFVNGVGAVNADNLNTFEQTCDNLAQARAYTGTQGSNLFTRNTDGSIAGGAGIFYWNLTSTATDDSGLTNIQPSGQAGAGRWLRINLNLNTLFFALFPSAAEGSIVYVSSSGSALAVLDPGTSGQTLHSGGAGAAPYWG